jgi:hypothetical protein
MTPDTPLVADGPEFAKIRPELRQSVREAELEFRKCLEDMLVAFPAHLAGGMGRIVVDVPARFIRGLLPFFSDLSEMMDFGEIIQKQLVKQGRPDA